MRFEKVESKRKSVHIIEQIMEAIRNGEYQIGDKLPPEREIAKKMEVSRASVREALSALQITGIVKARSGDGTYIKRSTVSSVDIIEPLIVLAGQQDILKALEAREILEIGAAQLAVERVTSQGIELVKKSLDQMRKSKVKKELEKYYEADYNFHLSIVKICNNTFLEQTISPILTAMRRTFWNEVKQKHYTLDEQNWDESFNNHRRIFLSLKENKITELNSAMEEHFNNVRKTLVDASELLQIY